MHQSTGTQSMLNVVLKENNDMVEEDIELRELERQNIRLIRTNRRLEEKLNKFQQENKKLNSNWSELKEFLEDNWQKSQDMWFVKLINKMREIEQKMI